jgi:hypothetical protein
MGTPCPLITLVEGKRNPLARVVVVEEVKMKGFKVECEQAK